MKVRFYRGPWDGKIKWMQPNMNVIRVASMLNNNFIAQTNLPDITPITVNEHTYVRTRHTHPDGSVYFEWDKPRGTRIK